MTSTAHDGSPGRVLVIEDDPVAAHFAMRVLGKRGGLEVRHTPDPAVALSLARSQTWDLVLTDAELPGMTGLEILTALRRLSPSLPVAVITAHESLDTAMQELRAAADEFLQKPVRPDHFLATVTALVARGRAARLAASPAGSAAGPAGSAGGPSGSAAGPSGSAAGPAGPPVGPSGSAGGPSGSAGGPSGSAAGPSGPPAVLAIGAHPGDVEIGAAGVLLVHRGLGHQIAILTLAPGDRSDRGDRLSGGDAGQPRSRAGEAELAALALGATLYQPDPPGSPDPAGQQATPDPAGQQATPDPAGQQAAPNPAGQQGTVAGDPLVSAIGRVVRAVRPAVVYTHSPHDDRQDHRDVHRAALAACRDTGSVYCFQSPTATIDFRPTRFVTIDDQLVRKLLAVNAFAARQRALGYPEQDLIESTARYWSRFTGGRYAEAFEVIRESAAVSGQPAPFPARQPAARTVDPRGGRSGQLNWIRPRHRAPGVLP